MKFKTYGPLVAIAAAGALTLSACGGDSGSSSSGAGSSLSGTLNGAGATSQQAAIAPWTAGFQTSNPNAKVEYAGGGSGAGVTQFLDGAIQFAGSDVALTSDQLDKSKSVCGDGGAINLPVYISPIAVVYNLPGVKDLNLTPQNLAKIFSGKINKWNDPALVADNKDANLPDKDISAVHRSDKSGTTANFTDYLNQAAPQDWTQKSAEEWPVDGGEGAQGTSGVIQAVQGGEGTIGYADASQAGSLGVAKVKVGDTFVGYTPEAAAKLVGASPLQDNRPEHDLALKLNRTTTDSSEYPIVLVSYHVVCTGYKDQATADLVKGWEKYVASSDGQSQAASAAGNAPISDDLRSKINTSIDAISVQK